MIKAFSDDINTYRKLQRLYEQRLALPIASFQDWFNLNYTSYSTSMHLRKFLYDNKNIISNDISDIINTVLFNEILSNKTLILTDSGSIDIDTSYLNIYLELFSNTSYDLLLDKETLTKFKADNPGIDLCNKTQLIIKQLEWLSTQEFELIYINMNEYFTIELTANQIYQIVDRKWREGINSEQIIFELHRSTELEDSFMFKKGRIFFNIYDERREIFRYIPLTNKTIKENNIRFDNRYDLLDYL